MDNYANILIYLIIFVLLLIWGDCVNSQRVSRVLRLYTYPLGVKWDVRGAKYMEEDRGCVVVVNHQSSFDILGLFWVWHLFSRMAAVAKREIFYVWPFGLSAYLAGVVFIDRGDSARAKKQLQQAARLMQEGTKLLLFPEGTRNKRRDVGTFKKGAFHLAVESQVDVLPIVISPYFFINPHRRFFGSGRVVLEALPPVPTSGLGPQDVQTLTEKVRTLMAEHYTKLADELRGDYPPDYPGLDM